MRPALVRAKSPHENFNRVFDLVNGTRHAADYSQPRSRERRLECQELGAWHRFCLKGCQERTDTAAYSLNFAQRAADGHPRESGGEHVGQILRPDPADRERRQRNLGCHLAQELGYPLGIGGSLSNLGLIALVRADYPAATTYYAESIGFAQQVGQPYLVAVGLTGLARCAAEQGAAPLAAQLLGAAHQRLTEMNVEPVASSPAEFAATLRKDSETWKRVIELGGVKLE